jgi:hypothetical protein
MGAPMLPTVTMTWSRHGGHPFGSGVDQPRKNTSRDNAMSARHKAHSDQASQAAVRLLIPPIPRPSRFDPSVTTILYDTTVSQALRQTLRGEVPKEYPPAPATYGTSFLRGHGVIPSPSRTASATAPLAPYLSGDLCGRLPLVKDGVDLRPKEQLLDASGPYGRA